jgi:hypothetical protein
MPGCLRPRRKDTGETVTGKVEAKGEKGVRGSKLEKVESGELRVVGGDLRVAPGSIFDGRKLEVGGNRRRKS